MRNRTSAVVPQELVTLNAVEDCMERVLARALSTLDGPVDMLDRAAQLRHSRWQQQILQKRQRQK